MTIFCLSYIRGTNLRTLIEKLVVAREMGIENWAAMFLGNLTHAMLCRKPFAQPRSSTTRKECAVFR
jgi:hypothetical protein